MSEVELMHRVAAGDSGSLDELFSTHFDAVFRLLRQLSGNTEDAEDLTQEVFLNARASGRSFRGDSSLRTWLTRIALNRYKRHTRREILHRLLRQGMPHEERPSGISLDGEWLLSGLRQLSEAHRTALLLGDVHEFSIKEIAAITGCPEGTVKARLHYARKQLREILVCREEGNHEK